MIDFYVVCKDLNDIVRPTGREVNKLKRMLYNFLSTKKGIVYTRNLSQNFWFSHQPNDVFA